MGETLTHVFIVIRWRLLLGWALYGAVFSQAADACQWCTVVSHCSTLLQVAVMAHKNTAMLQQIREEEHLQSESVFFNNFLRYISDLCVWDTTTLLNVCTVCKTALNVSSSLSFCRWILAFHILMSTTVFWHADNSHFVTSDSRAIPPFLRSGHVFRREWWDKLTALNLLMNSNTISIPAITKKLTNCANTVLVRGWRVQHFVFLLFFFFKPLKIGR